MSTAVSLLPLALLPALYAVFAKASAFLYRRAQLSWLHSFVFGALLALVGIASMLLHRAVGSPLPIPLASLLSLGVLVAVGGWYLGSRAKSANGTLLQFKGGAILALIAFGLVTVVGIVLAVLIPLLLHARQA